ncbi:L-xylulose 5-phosphate 3-epimerase [Paucilactobacillus oligofermentans DSM 15707 = LMG 22743]|uniref:L-ribulose-5-phosphate 3-epimerase n=1 Tax=Paucilactobacillus oligofermentans DSM 15707 = LMG 22743 TaxID=1423778 RepID=A0A0R1RNE9_9LACO|nr:L-ribulose-5-phosphate 3-epimerase [Paucilactobacillus oligofermentans]KRL55589.1 L-xylulose 5-phosphate 3-epimerase [Paucilactobacillus oligofermentans DSM 15707 = LMG 22743]CUS25422.1 L-ribulose-5-phosphate 3-epimerase 2 UlaE2 [Paucilactobacillus oligofermentans DSM 15707 = LMG 22743]
MISLGIYEKALPNNLSWRDTFELVKKLKFNFLEFSIDESDEKLARLEWTRDERASFRNDMWETGIRINTMMLSGHRRFPLGSQDKNIRNKSLEMMQKAIDLAIDLGIRNIQMAGYDVFYEDKSVNSRELYVENLAKCVNMAEEKGVMLSIETMDDPFINSLTEIAHYKTQVRSPWLQSYPDLGNLTAWPENDVAKELENNIANIAAVHLKDTLPVTSTSKGKFKNVSFGEGTVDFEGCLRTLKRLGYSGGLTIEMWCGSEENAIEQVMKAKLFFDQLFNTIGIVQEPVNDV